MAFSALKYLMQELGMKAGEYSSLSTKDKDDLKKYAEEENVALGGVSN